MDAELSLRGHDSLDLASFERNITRTARDGRPLIRNIRIHAGEEGVYWVSAEELPTRGGRGGWGLFGRRRDRGQPDAPADAQYNPVMIRTVTPFIPTINPPAQVDPNYTVADYLLEVKSANPGVDYSHRWWDEEPLRSAIWALGGAVVIGGIWPSIISLLIGAGFARKSEKDPDYDLSRFGKGQTPATMPAKAEPTEAELARLRQLEEELERNLAAGVETPPADSSTESTPAAQPLRVLSAGPIEPAASTEKPPEDKQYSGEFYPTVTHVKK